MKTEPNITIGTRVAFARAFLVSTGQYTGWRPFARGVVIDYLPMPRGVPTVCVVHWDDCKEPTSVLINNLVREDRIHLEPV